jgi:hypothetical protein
MTQPSENEPTLTDLASTLSDVVDRLEKLDEDVQQIATESERFNDRFANYQQATQWVVQLAFTLIASATLTVIITAIFKR